MFFLYVQYFPYFAMVSHGFCHVICIFPTVSLGFPKFSHGFPMVSAGSGQVSNTLQTLSTGSELAQAAGGDVWKPR